MDIILFGSAAKGKIIPRDIDICIVFKNKILPAIVEEIGKKGEKLNLRIHVSSLIVDNFFTSPHSLIRTILREGISIITGKSLSEQYGLVAYSLYSYSLTGIKASEKVRFVYAVKGRKNEAGFINKVRGEWIADSCFIIPIKRDNEVIELFKRWNIRYKRRPALLTS